MMDNLECMGYINDKILKQGNNYRYRLYKVCFFYEDINIFIFLDKDEQDELLDLLNEVDDGAEFTALSGHFVIFELIYSVFDNMESIAELEYKLKECVEEYLIKQWY